MLFVPIPAAAARLSTGDPLLTYVQARAAAMNGDHARAAELLAMLADAEPGQTQFAEQALSEAIGAGQMDLAVGLAAKMPADKLSTDARLLLVADAVKQRRLDRALPWLNAGGRNGDLSFLTPLLTAWDFAERGDQAKALATLDQIPAQGLLNPIRAEEQALILLKFRRTADAEPFAQKAIAAAGGRESRVRFALADGFLAAGDKTRAAAMVQGVSNDTAAARQRILSGRPSGEGIDTSAKALGEVLTGLAAEVSRMRGAAPPIGLVQVARYADPGNSSATALLALLLDAQDRTDEALALLGTVPQNDALISDVRDVQVRLLTDHKRYNEAYALALAAANDPLAGVSAYSRLGDVLEAMGRHDQAANAYGRAIALATAQGSKTEAWSMLLLQANALEESNRWPEAKAALQQGLALAPDQPLLLNFLGYAQLERGENMDAAEAMIRKASELAPDDASITDSLGWAQFKRGKVDEAIATLQQAAEKDPDQAEIQEHLGDALYKSGRRYEARFAWNAALVTAEDDIATRVKAKLSSGLTTANA
ncbi:MAG TPA: tetratricopeptide repeat protein, partial [Sphingomicrobium sp.]|nr:tetratricopeptide repeat protein [Sphingomicrobium sp.]